MGSLQGIGAVEFGTAPFHSNICEETCFQMKILFVERAKRHADLFVYSKKSANVLAEITLGTNMKKAISIVLAIALGVPAGWFVLSFFCGLPGLRFSVVCGHNAYIWLVIFIPASVALIWIVAYKFLLKGPG